MYSVLIEVLYFINNDEVISEFAEYKVLIEVLYFINKVKTDEELEERISFNRSIVLYK